MSDVCELAIIEKPKRLSAGGRGEHPGHHRQRGDRAACCFLEFF